MVNGDEGNDRPLGGQPTPTGSQSGAVGGSPAIGQRPSPSGYPGREAIAERQREERRDPEEVKAELREEVLADVEGDFSEGDVVIEETEDGSFEASISPDAIKRELRQDVAESQGVDPDDVVIEETEEGGFEASVSESAQKRELREDILSDVEGDYSAGDIVFSETEDGGLTASISEDAQRSQLREQVASEAGADFMPSDVVISETDDGLQANIAESAQKRELREDILSDVEGDFTADDIEFSTTDDGGLTASIAESAQEREITEDVLESAGDGLVSNEDVIEDTQRWREGEISRDELQETLDQWRQSDEGDPFEFTEADVVVEETDDGLQGRISEEAQRRELAENVAAMAGEGFTTDDVTIEQTEDGSFEANVAESAQKRELAEDVLADAPEDVTREDLEFEETEEGGFRATYGGLPEGADRITDALLRDASGWDLSREDIEYYEGEEGRLYASVEEEALPEGSRARYAFESEDGSISIPHYTEDDEDEEMPAQDPDGGGGGATGETDDVSVDVPDSVRRRYGEDLSGDAGSYPSVGGGSDGGDASVPDVPDAVEQRYGEDLSGDVGAGVGDRTASRREVIETPSTGTEAQEQAQELETIESRYGEGSAEAFIGLQEQTASQLDAEDIQSTGAGDTRQLGLTEGAQEQEMRTQLAMRTEYSPREIDVERVGDGDGDVDLTQEQRRQISSMGYPDPDRRFDVSVHPGRRGGVTDTDPDVDSETTGSGTTGLTAASVAAGPALGALDADDAGPRPMGQTTVAAGQQQGGPGIFQRAAQGVTPHAQMTTGGGEALQARAARENVFADRAGRYVDRIATLLGGSRDEKLEAVGIDPDNPEDVDAGTARDFLSQSRRESRAVAFQGAEVAERGFTDFGAWFAAEQPLAGVGPTLPFTDDTQAGDLPGKIVEFTAGGVGAGVGAVGQYPATAAADLERDAVTETQELDDPGTLDVPEQVPEGTDVDTIRSEVAERNPAVSDEDLTVTRTQEGEYDIDADLTEEQQRERVAASNPGVDPDDVWFTESGEARATTITEGGQTPTEVQGGTLATAQQTAGAQVRLAAENPYTTAALFALPAAEAAGGLRRGIREGSRGADVVRAREATTDAALRGDIPVSETFRDASARQAVRELEQRSAQQPDVIQQAVGTDQVLFHTTGSQLGQPTTRATGATSVSDVAFGRQGAGRRTVEVGEGASELPGLFMSPEINPVGLRSTNIRGRGSSSIREYLTPRRPDLGGAPDRVAAMPGDRVAAMPERAAGQGYEVRGPGGERLQGGLGRGEAKQRAADIEGAEVAPDTTTAGYEYLTQEAQPGTAQVKPSGIRSSEIESILPPESRFVERTGGRNVDVQFGGRVANVPGTDIQITFGGERVPMDAFQRAAEQGQRAETGGTTGGRMTGGEIAERYTSFEEVARSARSQQGPASPSAPVSPGTQASPTPTASTGGRVSTSELVTEPIDSLVSEPATSPTTEPTGPTTTTTTTTTTSPTTTSETTTSRTGTGTETTAPTTLDTSLTDTTTSGTSRPTTSETSPTGTSALDASMTEVTATGTSGSTTPTTSPTLTSPSPTPSSTPSTTPTTPTSPTSTPTSPTTSTTTTTSPGVPTTPTSVPTTPTTTTTTGVPTITGRILDREPGDEEEEDIPPEKRERVSAESYIGPGWYAETVTALALGPGADRTHPGEEELESRPAVRDWTSTLPVQAQVDADEETEEAIEEAHDFLTFGAESDDSGNGGDGWFADDTDGDGGDGFTFGLAE